MNVLPGRSSHQPGILFVSRSCSHDIRFEFQDPEYPGVLIQSVARLYRGNGISDWTAVTNPYRVSVNACQPARLEFGPAQDRDIFQLIANWDHEHGSLDEWLAMISQTHLVAAERDRIHRLAKKHKIMQLRGN